MNTNSPVAPESMAVPGASLTRRGLLAASGAIAAGGALAACSSSSSTAGASSSATIQIVVNSYQTYTTMIEAVLTRAWMKRTGVTVEIIKTAEPTLDSVTQRIETDLAAGHIDDIGLIGSNEILNYAQAHRAVVLNPLIATSHFNTAQLYPSMLRIGSVDSRLYALPYGMTTMILFYNKAAFKKAGLDPQSPPQTFSQLRAYSEAIVSSKAARYGASWGNDNSGNWCFQNFLVSNGGSMVGPDGKTPAFDSPQGVQVVEFWAQLFGDGLGQTMTQEELTTAFSKGDVAMMLASATYLTDVLSTANFPVGTALMPIPDGGTRRCVGVGAVLVILSKSARQQRAAFAAVAQLVGPASDTIVVEDMGWSPVNQVAATRPAYLGSYLARHPLTDAGTQSLKYLVPWFAWPGQYSAQITSDLDQQIILALLGRLSPAAALKTAAGQARDLLPA
jgi:multiple sugar transport system substrate-binding protein